MNPKYHKAPMAIAPPPMAAANSGVNAMRAWFGVSEDFSDETDPADAGMSVADDDDAVTSSAGKSIVVAGRWFGIGGFESLDVSFSAIAHSRPVKMRRVR
jgi:hypothetical protein